VRLQDSDGNVVDAFFSYRTAYLIQAVKKDKWFLVIGKPQLKYGKISFRYPEMILSDDPAEHKEELDDSQTGRIYPVYSEMMGIKPAWFAKKIFLLKDHIKEYCHEYLPEKFLALFQLMTVPETIKHMHFPDAFDLQKKAEYRVMYDRLLRIQLYSLIFRENYQNTIADTLTVKKVNVVKISPKKELVQQADLFAASDDV
jgi:ATP-dependent DNA helicase RecG